MNQEVPPHLSEKVFRRFEKILFRVVSEHPKPVSVDPRPFSAKTITGRLRDAMASHIQYNWKSVVDPAKLADIRGKIMVRVVEGMVVIKSKDEGEGESLEPTLIETPIGSVRFTVDEATEVDLHAFAHLLGRGLLTGPVLFKRVDPKLFDTILATYNVAIKQESDHYIML